MKFHDNIKIPRKRANFAARLEILWPAENCGSRNRSLTRFCSLCWTFQIQVILVLLVTLPVQFKFLILKPGRRLTPVKKVGAIGLSRGSSRSTPVESTRRWNAGFIVLQCTSTYQLTVCRRLLHITSQLLCIRVLDFLYYFRFFFHVFI